MYEVILQVQQKIKAVIYRCFIRLFKVSTKAKILVALAFMAFANMAFADSESLQKLFKEYNVSKDKQEYINKRMQ